MTDILPIDHLEVDAPYEIEAAAQNGAIFVMNISGGKDGLVAAHATMRYLDSIGHPRNLRYAMHADLGRAEWLETPDTVERQAEYLGLELMVVRRTKGDLVSVWEQRYNDGLPLYDDLKQIRLRGPWSGPGQKFCQPAMKRDQFVKHLRHKFPTHQVVCVIGVRRDESRDRANAQTLSLESRLSTPGRTQGLNWCPIAAWTTPEVLQYAKVHNLPMHEGYWRWGSSRLSCAMCVFASKSDIQASLSNPNNHALFHTLINIENRTGFAFQQGAWLSDARPDLLTSAEKIQAIKAKAYSHQRKCLEAQISDDFLANSKAMPWPRRLPTNQEADAIAQSRALVADWRKQEIPYLSRTAIIDRIGRLMGDHHVLTA